MNAPTSTNKGNGPSVRGPAGDDANLTMQMAKQIVHQDSFQNLLTGVGRQNVDKRMSTTVVAHPALNDMQTEALYRQNGFARRMIDLPANEMTREGFEIPQDTDGDIIAKFDKINGTNQVNWLAKMAKLTGGAIAVMGIDDGQSLEMPLFEQGIRDIHWLKVYDRNRITINELSPLTIDPMAASILTPEHYTINPVTGGQFIVHKSRVLRLDGQMIQDRGRLEQQGWSDSDLEAPYTRLRSLGAVLDSVEFIIEDFVTSTITVKGLQDYLQTETGTAAILKRLNIIDLSKHIMNTLMLDEAETFTKVTSTLSGLDKNLELFIRVLCATAQPMIPERLFLGYAPGGLGTSGEADLTNWYDSIKALQENWLQPPLRRLLEVIQLAKDGPTRGVVIPDWTIAFNPLWQPTESDREKTRLDTAKRDQIYIMTNVLLPEEVAMSRFGGDKYSPETELMDETIEARLLRIPDPVEPEPGPGASLDDDTFVM